MRLATLLCATCAQAAGDEARYRESERALALPRAAHLAQSRLDLAPEAGLLLVAVIGSGISPLGGMGNGRGAFCLQKVTRDRRNIAGVHGQSTYESAVSSSAQVEISLSSSSIAPRTE